MSRYILLVIIPLLYIGCSKTPDSVKEAKQTQTEHYSVLSAIPLSVQELENSTVYPGNSQPIYSLELISKQTYGKTGEPYLTSILSVVIDDQGRVIVWNMRSDASHVIYIYNDDGTFHSQLGGQGEGPGEYGHVVGLHARASKVFLYDLTGQRINEYSTTDYALLRTTLLEQWYRDVKPGYIEPRNDENYLVGFPDSPTKLGRLETNYLVMDSLGNHLDFEPLVLPDGFRIGVGEVLRPTMPLKFMGTTLRVLSDEDVLHTVFTREFLIKKYDAQGIYQSAIYYPIHGFPFNLDSFTPFSRFEPSVRDIRNAFARIGEVLPHTYPVVETLMVDDESRIWVAVLMDTHYEELEWWVLAASGELLAKMQSPRELRFVVKNGYLYGKEIDENTGIEFVVKYRINLVAN